jgi:alpha-galactosidase
MTESKQILWQNGTLNILLVVGIDGIVRISSILPHGTLAETRPQNGSSVPLFGVRLSGEGTQKNKSSKSQIGSYVSSRLKYQSHNEQSQTNSMTLRVTSYDEISKISVTAHFIVFPGIPVLRSYMTICNESNENVVVSQLSSLIVGGLGEKPTSCWLDCTLSAPTNT